MKLTLTFPLLLLLQTVSSTPQGIGGGVVILPSTTTYGPPPPTTVWITSTAPGGATTLVASIYTQQFSKQYDSIATPSSGSIGLGTQTGKVGVVRETRVSAAGVKVGGEQGGAWMLGMGVGALGVVAGGMLVF